MAGSATSAESASFAGRYNWAIIGTTRFKVQVEPCPWGDDHTDEEAARFTERLAALAETTRDN